MPAIARKPPTRDEIERRAYEIYLERGGQEGQELADWLTAERELTESAQAAVPTASRMKSTASGQG